MSEYSEAEVNSAKMKAALEASEALPLNTFAAVPDEDIVTIEVSGQFSRVLNKVLEYLYQCEPEAEVIKSANLIANNFDGLKPADISQHALALWAVSNLLANFSLNAGVQNKTKIYDRDKIMSHIFGGVTGSEPLTPLTQEELEERQINHKEALTKVNDDKPVTPRADKIINHDETTIPGTKSHRRKQRNVRKTSAKHKVNRTAEELEERRIAKILRQQKREKGED
tara:strand:- start:5 stop:682 length:678 start_codon:yes stop_codon:yes gene_type:complete